LLEYGWANIIYNACHYTSVGLNNVRLSGQSRKGSMKKIINLEPVQWLAVSLIIIGTPL
jgi:hypothetical protein